MSYQDHVVSEEIRSRIQDTAGIHDELQTMEKNLIGCPG